ncbi:hypothetical protein BKA66DRAFT_544535 [Pyrenochaeta sp. MPI-SDFR-AT-0127]|nr:hypothetical protein BKA66DRAFT_544535 [Pyrenochaeta sp. MPI-SDFR-AT-0127]
MTAPEYPASPTLDPQLYEDGDDEDDIRWKAPLEALMNGTLTPLQAAQNIDKMLRTETSERLQMLIDFAKSHSMDIDEEESYDWGGLPAPNAGAFAEDIIRSYCRVCMAFSPYSEGQNRLIKLLEELRGLPRWMAPESRPDESGNFHKSEFWLFGYNWLGLEDQFRRQHPQYYRDTAAHNRWRNFQHVMARITASKLIYCAPFNALQDIVPQSDKRSLECDIIAAAQWVLWPTECRYVYKECLKRQTTTHHWEPWSKEGWSLFKKGFEVVVENEEYNSHTKSIARQALEQMNSIEKEIAEDAGREDGSSGGGSN